jgi:hypothetical protein
MEGQSRDEIRDITYIQKQRDRNKVFGLRNPESWSGCKQLVDFLDDIFNISKDMRTKLDKPVSIRHPSITPQLTHIAPLCLLHYQERWPSFAVCSTRLVGMLCKLGANSLKQRFRTRKALSIER